METLLYAVVSSGILLISARFIIWPYLQGFFNINPEKVEVTVLIITASLLGILALLTMLV